MQKHTEEHNASPQDYIWILKKMCRQTLIHLSTIPALWKHKEPFLYTLHQTYIAYDRLQIPGNRDTSRISLQDCTNLAPMSVVTFFPFPTTGRSATLQPSYLLISQMNWWLPMSPGHSVLQQFEVISQKAKFFVSLPEHQLVWLLMGSPLSQWVLTPPLVWIPAFQKNMSELIGSCSS